MANNKVLGNLQKLGKALMTPVAVLPAAGLLLRLGQPDVFNIPWMAAAGDAIFSNLAIIFAIGIAVGLAEENNGVAGIAAAVGYFVIKMVAISLDKSIDMGVLGGIIAGILAGVLYNRYKAVKLPDFLGFFGGKRFVPIVTSLCGLIIGIISGFVWPVIQRGLDAFGNGMISLGAVGAGLFGFFNRLLIPFGLHHILNTIFWQQVGTFTVGGQKFTGDVNRFIHGDPTAGAYMTGFFPIMMFALPAACLAMITTARKENRKAVTGMLLGIAFTSFLTGITEPIEFAFMFLAPVLYGVHAVLTGAALAITTALGVKDGFSFSAGFIDYALNYGKASKPILLLVIGLIFAVIYYFIFVFVITKLDLPTPGRAEDEESATLSGLNNSGLTAKAAEILEAIGTKANIDSIDACVTRIRLTAKNPALVDDARLKQIGATGVMKMGGNNFQIVVGTVADPLVTHIKSLMKK